MYTFRRKEATVDRGHEDRTTAKSDHDAEAEEVEELISCFKHDITWAAVNSIEEESQSAPASAEALSAMQESAGVKRLVRRWGGKRFVWRVRTFT